MTALPTDDLNQTLIARCRGDAVLQSLVGQKAYTNVPQEVKHPFVVISDWTETDWGEKDSPGWDMTVVVHAWVQDTSTAVYEKIKSAIYALLHEQTFSFAGFQVVDCRFVSCTNQVEDDGRTRHASSIYRFIVTPIPS